VPLGGHFATRATVFKMRDIANAAMTDPVVMRAAADAVRGVDGKNPAALAFALLGWLTARVQFLPDPLVNGDVLRTPRYLLSEIARTGIARGDCDDCAMLAAAMAKSIGLAARFVVLAFTPGAPFEHVFTQVRVPRGWFPLDVTEPARAGAYVPSNAFAVPV
jgi:transglutaminase-like putative cysteine protease